jgi:hypothetical protein
LRSFVLYVLSQSSNKPWVKHECIAAEFLLSQIDGNSVVPCIIVSCSLRIILDPPQNNAAKMARCRARRTPLLLTGGARPARPLFVIGDDAGLLYL